eukprot:CAMPEP_0172532998 /NCGR_PEP_ID=MMETSP1067-20121228/5850_1 /TAXON_ID=265564 ORGANISM="Thalassiosira punctigera, Strain Tpunct2005C2" /NCGR_SAMPLE_ID=MMETSP1067 /ASSEMBLY_ACC=CAM_ASM_000444 /LENGTH=157 /DNA_ID=CAMNT_0013317581 /DNA_START=125 /DNA_END=598 /DNA_ORIENTATION=+
MSKEPVKTKDQADQATHRTTPPVAAPAHPAPANSAPAPANSARRSSRASWLATDWDEAYYANPKSSMTSALTRSTQNSLYHILDFDARCGHNDAEGEDKKTALRTKKRKSLQEALKHDEEAFEKSLASLCIRVEKKPSGSLNASMISMLSVTENPPE